MSEVELDDAKKAGRAVWLDCDPGHDDAIAILLAIHCKNLDLLGVSTVHGNTDATNTCLNAARCLHAFGAQKDISVYPGARCPLMRSAKHDPEIHGPDGLGGVDGLPPSDQPDVRARIKYPEDGHPRAIEAIAQAIRHIWNSGDPGTKKITIVSTGPMTNVALFVSVYPDLLHAVEEFVFMGGAVGMGNRSSVAEYNVLCDPEAAQIVLNAPIKKTMVPINVTHTAIVTSDIHAHLLSPTDSSLKPTLSDSSSITLPRPQTPLRHTLSTLISFFADSYRSTFGFDNGPPLHDALTIAYVSDPTLLTCKRYRVDVEVAGQHTVGETVLDMWNYRGCGEESWGSEGKNCLVAEKLDVSAFFALFLNCVAWCDDISPLNKHEVV